MVHLSAVRPKTSLSCHQSSPTPRNVAALDVLTSCGISVVILGLSARKIGITSETYFKAQVSSECV